MELLSRESLSRIINNESIQDLLNACGSINIQSQSESIEKWLDWCEDQKSNLKIISRAVPSGILPPESSGYLLDVRVSGRGPDDKIYGKNLLIRQRVARGNSVLRFKDPSGTVSYRPMIFALKKFSGEKSVDEDEEFESFDSELYFLKPMKEFKEVVAMQKANGEAAHLSIHHFEGHGFVFCIGSKNVHLLARFVEDIDKYTEDRYAVAKVVARAVFSSLAHLSPETQEVMFSLSAHCQLSWTFELLNPDTQHVVNLSHLGSPQLNFIAWTLPDFEGKASSLCALRPDVALTFVKEQFKISTVDHEVVTDKSLRSKDVKLGYGFEGEVLYLVDGSNNVIGLIKTKTVWYIILRAIREKAKFFKGNAEFGDRVVRRIKEIKKWLNLSEDVTQRWIQLALDFGKWLDAGKRDPSDDFPNAWKSFLLKTNSSDEISPEFES